METKKSKKITSLKKKNAKSKKKKAQSEVPKIDIYRFLFFYSYDGSFNDHNSTRQRGLYLEVRDSESHQAYIDAEFSKYGKLEPIYYESAKNMRRIIHNWTINNRRRNRNGHPIEVHCSRELEKDYNESMEIKRYKRLTPAERVMIENALNSCKEEKEPEIKLIFQENGKKTAEKRAY
jgi:hypothetical protein